MLLLTTVIVALVHLSACASTPTPTAATPYTVDIQPSDFVEAVDNPCFPLLPGTVRVYESTSEEGVERITVEVLPETRDVMGVAATVVHDTVTLNGQLVEDTYDWYAQDSSGCV